MYGIQPMSTELAEVIRTLGGGNTGPRVGPIIISEIFYHPPDLADGSDNSTDEFIELRNISGQAVDLFDVERPTNTWQVTGGVSYSFPGGRTLNVGAAALVVNFDPSNTVVAAAFTTKMRFVAASNATISAAPCSNTPVRYVPRTERVAVGIGSGGDARAAEPSNEQTEAKAARMKNLAMGRIANAATEKFQFDENAAWFTLRPRFNFFFQCEVESTLTT